MGWLIGYTSINRYSPATFWCLSQTWT